MRFAGAVTEETAMLVLYLTRCVAKVLVPDTYPKVQNHLPGSSNRV
jgi:hypothetical protein